jgi:hypothetical protein
MITPLISFFLYYFYEFGIERDVLSSHFPLTVVSSTKVLVPADHSGGAVEGMNCFRTLEHWDRGFESNSRHGYLCAFILCLCCCVCR